MGFHKVSIRGQFRGEEIQLTRYWATAGANPDLQTFADALGADFETQIDGAIPDSIIWNDIAISNPLPGNFASVVIPANFPFAGTLNDVDILPLFNAVQLNYFSTANSYPRRGYNRIAGVTEAQITAGALNATFLPIWTGVAATLGGLVTTSENWSPVLWSERYQVANPITSFGASARLATQKSRGNS